VVRNPRFPACRRLQNRLRRQFRLPPSLCGSFSPLFLIRPPYLSSRALTFSLFVVLFSLSPLDYLATLSKKQGDLPYFSGFVPCIPAVGCYRVVLFVFSRRLARTSGPGATAIMYRSTSAFACPSPLPSTRPPPPPTLSRRTVFSLDIGSDWRDQIPFPSHLPSPPPLMVDL